MTDLTFQEAEIIADKAAKKAVCDLLVKLGIDVENVHGTQADFAHLRKQRLTAEQVGTWTRRTVVIAFLTTLGSLLFIGIQSAASGIKHITP